MNTILQKILNIIGVAAIVLVVAFWQSLLRFLVGLGAEDFQMINTFLGIILSWPVAVLIICLVFFYRFSKQISAFLENISTVKWGSFEAQRQGDKQSATENVTEKTNEDLAAQGITLTNAQWQHIENLVNELTTTQNQQSLTIQQYQEALKATFERAENFEFAYLNLALVLNSKFALLWFKAQPSKSSTKQNFCLVFQLPPQIFDHNTEKEAIFNVLLANALITQNGELFTISEKGEKFLKHIGLLRT